MFINSDGDIELYNKDEEIYEGEKIHEGEEIHEMYIDEVE